MNQEEKLKRNRNNEKSESERESFCHVVPDGTTTRIYVTCSLVAVWDDDDFWSKFIMIWHDSKNLWRRRRKNPDFSLSLSLSLFTSQFNDDEQTGK